MSEWSITKETVLPPGDNPLDNQHYGYRVLNLLLGDGQKAIYHGLVVPDCVHVVALEDDETTYLVRQSRPNVMPIGATTVPETLELPGGFAHPTVTLADSAQMELGQEIGRSAGVLARVGINWPYPGISNERDHIFLGTDLSPVTLDGTPEATEQDIRVESGRFGVLYDQMLRSRLPVSGQTIAAMAKVAVLL